MLWEYKYDIAISVAEEDILVARQIEKALTSRNISCFLYTERQAEIWGEHLLKICLDAFGADARYVLMLTSSIYAEQYWGTIEGLIAEAHRKRRNPYVLQLRIESSKIDIIRGHIAYQDWNNNPNEIADLIESKLQKEEKKTKIRLITLLVTIIVITTVFFLAHLQIF